MTAVTLRTALAGALFAGFLALGGCAGPAAGGARPEASSVDATSVGGRIVIAGERLDLDAPVVAWTDPGGHDAYARGLGEACYGVPRGGTPDELAARIDLLVLHYDACGTSRVCFEALRQRGLSVHFLLDLDGTLYQTLDLRETAWHATVANERSIGVEIAHIGAYAPGDGTLDAWYPVDAAGPWIRLPERYGIGGLRTPGFVGRPARAARTRGVVNGSLVEQHDFTPEQYETLARLAAALCRAFPRIRAEAPRGPDGRVRADALSETELARFHGILGHSHVQTNKTDPGPAFDWERFLAAVRNELEADRAHP